MLDTLSRADLAHAINDPLAALVTNLTHIAEALEQAPATADAEVREALREARESAERIQSIIKQLASAPRNLAPSRPPSSDRRERLTDPRDIRVLVIDNEQLVGSALRRSLRDYDVDVLDNAKEALQRLASGASYDVILCDLMMPQMTGMEFYEELVRVAPDHAPKVVFITGGATAPRTRHFVASVPNTVLEKPFDVVALRQLIRERAPRAPEGPRVFVVDDDESARNLAVRWLADAKFDCVACASGQEMITAIAAQPERVEAIVLDVMMPGIDGFRVVDALKANEKTAHIPVILLSAHATSDAAITRGVATGAACYLTKPFSGAVLVAQVRAACERFEAERDLRRRLRFAEEHATTDGLTGLMNRRCLEQRLEEAAAHATRHREALSLVMLDIDHFKKLNDTYGHDGGDRVLLYFARALRRTVRVADHAFRYGGEEFALLLPKCDVEGAVRAVTRVQKELGERPVAIGGGQELVRFSAGISTANERNGFRVDDLLGRADAALYEAKRAGRNRIVPEHTPQR